MSKESKKEPLKYRAYQIIKDNIINCTYAPGAIINEEMIREAIPASRTPIRDALSRLEQEGLITILPKKGIIVSSMTVRELNMLYESRKLIEPYVVEHYGNRISKDIFLSFYRCYQNYLDGTDTHYSYTDMDESLHKIFIEAADNTYFTNLYSTIESQIRRTRAISGRVSNERLRYTMQEHIAIVEAALKNDWDAAADAMKHHLSMSEQVIFDYILKNQNMSLGS